MTSTSTSTGSTGSGAGTYDAVIRPEVRSRRGRRASRAASLADAFLPPTAGDRVARSRRSLAGDAHARRRRAKVVRCRLERLDLGEEGEVAVGAVAGGVVGGGDAGGEGGLRSRGGLDRPVPPGPVFVDAPVEPDERLDLRERVR